MVLPMLVAGPYYHRKSMGAGVLENTCWESPPPGASTNAFTFTALCQARTPHAGCSIAPPEVPSSGRSSCEMLCAQIFLGNTVPPKWMTNYCNTSLGFYCFSAVAHTIPSSWTTLCFNPFLPAKVRAHPSRLASHSFQTMMKAFWILEKF